MLRTAYSAGHIQLCGIFFILKDYVGQAQPQLQPQMGWDGLYFHLIQPTTHHPKDPPTQNNLNLLFVFIWKTPTSSSTSNGLRGFIFSPNQDTHSSHKNSLDCQYQSKLLQLMLIEPMLTSKKLKHSKDSKKKLQDYFCLKTSQRPKTPCRES